jgi:nucleotide-binding universal stress UspA family protein
MIIVPVDFSDASTTAIEQAKRFADSPDDITVVHAVSSGEYASTGWLLGRLGESEQRESAKKALDKFVSSHAGLQSCLLFGQPADAITKFAEDEDAKLIVIPSRSHGLERWLLGSIAKRVVEHAPCDVLVLPRGLKSETVQ